MVVVQRPFLTGLTEHSRRVLRVFDLSSSVRPCTGAVEAYSELPDSVPDLLREYRHGLQTLVGQLTAVGVGAAPAPAAAGAGEVRPLSRVVVLRSVAVSMAAC